MLDGGVVDDPGSWGFGPRKRCRAACVRQVRAPRGMRREVGASDQWALVQGACAGTAL